MERRTRRHPTVARGSERWKKFEYPGKNWLDLHQHDSVEYSHRVNKKPGLVSRHPERDSRSSPEPVQRERESGLLTFLDLAFFTRMILLLLIQITHTFSAPLPSLGLLEGKDGYLIKEYINAITAYGPGLGVYTPYQYVDVSYNNLPFVGKIPVFGKEGTSSRLGISPFYPPEGNPSNPFPPLYRARPLPLHVPEPQDVVAVPLDEEALHGEPLFPPELILPSEEPLGLKTGPEKPEKEPSNPFAGSEDLQTGSFVNWPVSGGKNEDFGARIETIPDRIEEETKKLEDLKNIAPRRDGERSPPIRTKRIFL